MFIVSSKFLSQVQHLLRTKHFCAGRWVLPPSIQKSALVKAQIVFYLFAVTRRGKERRRTSWTGSTYPSNLVRVLLVFLLYILSRTGEAKRNPLEKNYSFASELPESFLSSYQRFVDMSQLIFSKFLAVLCLPVTWHGPNYELVNIWI